MRGGLGPPYHADCSRLCTGPPSAATDRAMSPRRHLQAVQCCRLRGPVCGVGLVRLDSMKSSWFQPHKSLPGACACSHLLLCMTRRSGRQAFCKEELEQGQYLLQLRAAAEAEDATSFWHALFCQAKSLGAMYWCNQGSLKLQRSAEQARTELCLPPATFLCGSVLSTPPTARDLA